MSEELISKKEVLNLTGISYGQLYRWKRKSLIPEDWFVRKSTFTGQETFFPKEKILERVEKIQKMKDSLSLDELADLFSLNASNLKLTKESLIAKGIAIEPVMNIFLETQGELNEFNYHEILKLYILSILLESGDIHIEEGKMLLQLLNDHRSILQQPKAVICFIRKLGMSSCLISVNGEQVLLEKGTKVAATLSIEHCAEELKSKLV
ncbi:YhbD family protein [Cytobacillus firmus]|uniref:YhbD family protein n=1 Tax=Cytobacillus firmus TaxID=1399 RepID=UPI00222815F6|nr:YhbD family protein [Cytobacillus firmus]